MEKGNWKMGKVPALSTIFHFPFSIFLFGTVLALSACGVPGDPRPPRPVVPMAVTDLQAQQSGGAVTLTFTLPTKSTEGQSLAQFPDLEIYRSFAPAGTAPERAKLPEVPLYTVPSALVATYLVDRDPAAVQRVRFEDPVREEEVQARREQQWVYLVRTRASERRSSEASNVVAVRVLPVPPAVNGVTATVTESGVKLQWAAAAPSAIAPVVGYRVYRAEVAPGKEAEAQAQPATAELVGPPRLVAVAPSAEWSDTQAEFGRGYRYTVRSVVQHAAESVESEDSEPVIVVPRDTFAPAAPVNLVAVVVAATAEAAGHIELSWGISAEPDVAGYSVYRWDGTREEKITPELLLTPTFRDTSVAPGRRYTYRVTATDRAGNESARSEPVSESVPSP
jgi:hypothetical protein